MAQVHPFLTALIVVALLAWINRVRGGGLGGQFLPGRALLWASVAVGLIATLVSPTVTVTLPYWGPQTGAWPVGVAWGLGYLFWGLWSWGYAFAALGGIKPDRSPTVLENLLALFGPPVAQTFVRHLFVLVGVALVAWLIGNWWLLLAAPVFAAAATAVYTGLFRPLGTHDWMRAEIATGALWGILIFVPDAL